MTRAVVAILDSFGIGSTPDADKFDDTGANTLLSIAQACARGEADDDERQGPLQLPNLTKLGLGHAAQAACDQWPTGFDAELPLEGVACAAAELSSGKDTPSGHWELAGVPVLFDWGYFSDKTNSFPPEFIAELCKRAKISGILGNCHASGTEILVRLGDEHVQSGLPICYTSADSVFQIAAHEEHYGLDRLYQLCEIARELCDDYNIGRVIARPFVGTGPEDYIRTGNRKDYSVLPPAPTVLDKLCDAGGQVFSVGKIADIFAHQGISKGYKAHGNDAIFDATLQALADAPDRTLVFSNFVDFDMLYGHRRDVIGYAKALEAFDRRLPELLAQLGDDDLLLISADHGCDPTWKGTEHTREYVPILAFNNKLEGVDLGKRSTFADAGQTLANWFDLAPLDVGSDLLA